MIFIGIDPGKKGALAWMDGERTQINVHDVTLLPDGDYDLFGMYKLLQDACRNGAAETRVIVEKVHAMPGDGKCSDFTFGLGFGTWLAFCASLRLTPTLVPPQTWKRTMLAGVPNDKTAEAKALKQRFQGHAIASQLHGPRGGLRDGRVDALWLAEYGRVTYKIGARVVA